jgi:hypothetical protein
MPGLENCHQESSVAPNYEVLELLKSCVSSRFSMPWWLFENHCGRYGTIDNEQPSQWRWRPRNDAKCSPKVKEKYQQQRNQKKEVEAHSFGHILTKKREISRTFALKK